MSCQKLGVDAVCKKIGCKMCQKLGVNVVPKDKCGCSVSKIGCGCSVQNIGYEQNVPKTGCECSVIFRKDRFFFRFYLLMSSSAIVWNIQSYGRQGEQK